MSLDSLKQQIKEIITNKTNKYCVKPSEGKDDDLVKILWDIETEILEKVGDLEKTHITIRRMRLKDALNILASGLYDHVGDEAYSLSWFEETLRAWAERELLGDEK